MADDAFDPRFVEFARTGSIELRNQLVLANRGLAVAFARRYRDRGVATDDLVQIALEALVQAVDRFEPERGLRFSTFAARTIDGRLKQYFRDKTWDLKVPRRTRQLVVALGKATERLGQRNGRAPTPRELADELDLDLADVTLALEAASAYRSEDLDGLAVSVPGDDPALDRADARIVAPQLLGVLTDEERRVVELRFFGEKTQSEIAAEIGVSQMQISRILRRSLDKLRGELPETGDAV